jgi:hypothetical protein
MPSVVEQLALDKQEQARLARVAASGPWVQKFPDAWSQFLLRAFGAGKATKVLSIQRCARCQGRVRTRQVYVKGELTTREYYCTKCGRTAPVA